MYNTNREVVNLPLNTEGNGHKKRKSVAFEVNNLDESTEIVRQPSARSKSSRRFTLNPSEFNSLSEFAQLQSEPIRRRKNSDEKQNSLGKDLDDLLSKPK